MIGETELKYCWTRPECPPLTDCPPCEVCDYTNLSNRLEECYNKLLNGS